MSGGGRNITVGDVIPIRRTIQTTIERICRFRVPRLPWLGDKATGATAVSEDVIFVVVKSCVDGIWSCNCMVGMRRLTAVLDATLLNE
jgi:hypothetical protein